MKALTLTQPWATLVAIGAKRIETRSWWTPHRGVIAIHAAKTVPPWARGIPHEWPFGEVLRAAGIPEKPNGDPDLPLGALIAVAELVQITSTPCIAFVADYGAPFESDFGDYSDGRWAWRLTNVRPLHEPIPCRGALGLWELPADVEERLDFQLLGTPDPREVVP